MKVSLIDDNGTIVTDTFPNAPIELEKSDLIEKGEFYENEEKIDFGQPKREICITAFIFTPGIGFFGSSLEVEIAPDGNGMTFDTDAEVVMQPGSLEIEKDIID